MIRSQLGRADPALVEKAARLAGVTPAQFCAGSDRQATVSAADGDRADRASRRKSATHDSVTSLVLAMHAEADRPLGFDRVVDLSGNRVTRAQVRTASAALCRDGQLDRIRSGGVPVISGPACRCRQIPGPAAAARPSPAGLLSPRTG